MSSINEVIDQAQLLYPLNYQSSAGAASAHPEKV